MEIKIYSFSKRDKSTKQPIVEGSTTIYVQLKDECTITRPVFKVQNVQPVSANYIYVPKWDRYYFVNEQTSVEGMWEIQCVEDTLASFKDDIGNTSAMVLYASGSTKNIVDNRIPVLAPLIKGHTYKAPTGFTFTDGQAGAIILGITGKGSFGPYLMQDSNKIKEILNGVDAWTITSITSVVEASQQLFYGGSAAECFKSAFKLPMVIGGGAVSTGNAEPLYLGNYPCKDSNGNAITGYHIDKPIISSGTEIDIPWQSSDWRRVSSLTTINVYIPFCGMVTIPATECQGVNKLHVQMAVNVTSGDIAVQIRLNDANGQIIGNASGNCAIPTAYGSTGIDTTKFVQSNVAGIGSAAALGVTLATGGSALAVIGAGTALVGAAMSLHQSEGGVASGSAGLGGGAIAAMDKVIHVWVSQMQLTDSQANINPILGKPYMGVATIGSFSGFVQTDNFQFASSRAYASEIAEINAALNYGIYYE